MQLELIIWLMMAIAMMKPTLSNAIMMVEIVVALVLLHNTAQTANVLVELLAMEYQVRP